MLFGGRRGLVLEGGALHCAAKTESNQSAFSSGVTSIQPSWDRDGIESDDSMQHAILAIDKATPIRRVVIEGVVSSWCLDSWIPRYMKQNISVKRLRRIDSFVNDGREGSLHHCMSPATSKMHLTRHCATASCFPARCECGAVKGLRGLARIVHFQLTEKVKRGVEWHFSDGVATCSAKRWRTNFETVSGREEGC